MKKLSYITYIILFSSLLFFTYCNSGNSSRSDQMSSLLALENFSYTEIAPLNNVFTDTLGTGYDYYHLNIPEQTAGDNVSFDYTFDTGAETKDIYFIFTNISPSQNSTYPVISSTKSVTQSALPLTVSKPKSLEMDSHPMKGKPEISEFNRNPYAYLNTINPVNMLLSLLPSTKPNYDYKDQSGSFIIDIYGHTIDATCQYVSPSPVETSYGNKTLNIWVANDCLSLIDSTLIQNMADNFLKDNVYNDIYDWVTNIYGTEYGGTDWSSVSTDDKKLLITPNDEITILLYDIDGDKTGTSKGVVLGYFWAKDNFKKSVYSISNERVMFYMDAYVYGNMVPGIPSDEILSALAHEFQHMIHFYQKTVLRTNGAGTETWIDEMSSMVTEDLVADKLQVNGPRGVSYLYGSDGPIENKKGRLPIFIYFDEASVTNWYSGDDVAISYSINYALGAYLARNYGGPQFFHDVIHNAYTDYRAIEYALSQYALSHAGSPTAFGDILARWGVSTLLSDKINTLDDYKYNSGDWFTDSYGSTSYNVGSINMYNYRYAPIDKKTGDTILIQDGPYIYSESHPLPTYYSMPKASNIYYKAAQGLTGPQTWNIKLRRNVRLTVVAK